MVYQTTSNQFMCDTTDLTLSIKIMLYIKKDSLIDKYPEVGDLIHVKGQPSGIPGPKNPHVFDYASYMKGRNVFYQDFVDREDYQIIKKDNPLAIMKIAYKIRQNFESIIKDHVEDEDSQAIALALLIGQKDELNQNIKKNLCRCRSHACTRGFRFTRGHHLYDHHGLIQTIKVN